MDYVIGISTYRGAGRLEWTLRSLQDLSGVKTVVVVDDGSPHKDFVETSAIVQNQTYPITLCRFTQNRGLPSTYNEILRHSEGRSVILLDDDALLPPNFLTVLNTIFSANEVAVAGFVGDKTIYESSIKSLTENEKVQITGTDHPPEFATELAGFCYAINGNLVPLGDPKTRFDNIYRHYIQDSDFCCQQAAAGIPSFRFHWPRIPHKEHATLDVFSELKAQESVKSDISMFKKKWEGKSPKDKEREFVDTLKFGRVSFLFSEGGRKVAYPVYEEAALCQPM